MCLCVCRKVYVGLSSKIDPAAQPRILTPTRTHRKQAHLQSYTTSVKECAAHWPAKVLSRSNSGYRQSPQHPHHTHTLGYTICRRSGCLTSLKHLLHARYYPRHITAIFSLISHQHCLVGNQRGFIITSLPINQMEFGEVRSFVQGNGRTRIVPGSA